MDLQAIVLANMKSKVYHDGCVYIRSGAVGACDSHSIEFSKAVGEVRSLIVDLEDAVGFPLDRLPHV